MTKQQLHETSGARGAGRRHRLLATVGGVLLASTVATPAQAVALGEVHVRSSLGEPLVAEVSLPAGDRGNLEVVPAPAAAYSQHGLQPPERLGRITTTLVRTADGRQALRITSTGPVNDPIVDLLVQARDQSGRLDRQLTLLVNPAQMGSGARSSAAAAFARAPRLPAGAAVQDVHTAAPLRTKHPIHKKKALPKARRKSKTAAAAVRKPVVAAAHSKSKVVPEAVNGRTSASAAAPRNELGRAGEAIPAVPHNDQPAVVTAQAEIAATGTAAAASGTAAPASDAATAPAPDASSAAAGPTLATVTGDNSTDSSAEAIAAAAPKPAIPVTPKAQAPAEHPADYGRWSASAALIALLLAGGWLWQRRRRQEGMLEVADEDELLDDDPAPAKVFATKAVTAADAPLRSAAQDVAASASAAAAPVPAHESLPDFGVTRAVPEEDPVAQADVYLSAGKVDEARSALEEGLWLDGDHIAILLKLLSIHADRGDVSAFNESAARLAQETARSRRAWREACEIGHRLDPANALYAGDAGAVDAPAVGANGTNHGDRPPPATPLPGIAGVDQAVGSSAAESALPLALEPIEIERSDDLQPGALSGAKHDDASAEVNERPSMTLPGETKPASESAARFGSEPDQAAVDAKQEEPGDGVSAEPEGTAPELLPEASLQVTAAAPGGERDVRPSEEPLAAPGVADARSFDQLPTLLRQATERADGGDRRGALELAAEVARLLSALRNEALALAPNSYA